MTILINIIKILLRILSIRQVRIFTAQKGLLMKNGEFKRLLDAGSHWLFDPFGQLQVDIVDQRAPWFDHDQLDLIAKTGVLEGLAVVLNLEDYQRALIWIDGRFNRIIANGQYALWTTFRQIDYQVIDTRDVRFNHSAISVITKTAGSRDFLEEIEVIEDHVGVYFRNAQYVETLPSGRYVFWRGVDRVKIFQVNMAELALDIAGQDIMSADKVTLRMNTVIAYRVSDPVKSVRESNDLKQSLYREAQLALRAIVGGRDLDGLLAQKDALAGELAEMVSPRAEALGLRIVSLGIRDIILPGDMKDLLNKVTEAKKAAEANLIVRREETAAMRSQANTAKLLENNPALMRLRELEVLEKISANTKLNVVLGEKGLTDRVVNLL